MIISNTCGSYIIAISSYICTQCTMLCVTRTSLTHSTFHNSLAYSTNIFDNKNHLNKD